MLIEKPGQNRSRGLEATLHIILRHKALSAAATQVLGVCLSMEPQVRVGIAYKRWGPDVYLVHVPVRVQGTKPLPGEPW